jgi:hypothetical protein
MLTTPNIQSITNASNGYDFQAWEDETDLFAQLYASSGTAYVISGCEVTFDTSMTVSISAGYYCINGTIYSYAGGTQVIAANSGASGDRRDIVTLNTSLASVATTGTPCGTSGWVRTTSALPPVKPAIPANQVLIAEVGVLYNTTTLASINIVDKTTTGGSLPGQLLCEPAYYAPTSAHTYTVVIATTGLTALDSTNLAQTFVGPLSGFVDATVKNFWKGTTATAGGSGIGGVVSSTGSPGTLVASGLAWLTPAAAADSGECVSQTFRVAVTPGTTYTWYSAAAYSGQAQSIIAQSCAANTTVPTGGPCLFEVRAA